MTKGAIYRRCDFQVHTPRDDNFSGREYVSDSDRLEYSRSFIASCREKKLDAVAITDHHDLVFFDYIKIASESEIDDEGNLVREEDRIVVFPGMELTLDVPCQALIIFDATLEINEESRARIYTALGINNFNSISESKAVSPVERLSFNSINDVYESLNSLEFVKNRFIVFPNVKDNGGDSILRTGFHNEYANGIFVGGYLDKGQYDSHKSKQGWFNVISGKTEAYGNRPIGIFQTSDCRSENFDDLGCSSTWVKWSKPTAEGLRQACLARYSRISQEEPEIPQTKILQISVLNSSFLKDIVIDFNGQFNVLIGGRGTGKSSILQYIAWALGKDASPKKKQELEAFVGGTLGDDSSVSLVAEKNNVIHVIERTLSSYRIKIGDQEWQNATNENILNVLPADSFSQKELSKHEKNRVEQLTQLLEYSINDDLNSCKRLVKENGNQIKEFNAIFESVLQNKTALKGINTQIESINEQLSKLLEELDEVPEADKKILREHNLIQNEKQLLSQSENQINDVKESLEDLVKSMDLDHKTFQSEYVLHNSKIKLFVDAQNNFLDSIKQQLENILTTSDSDRDLAKQSIELLHTEHDKKYAAAKERQSKFEIIIHTIEALRNQLKMLLGDKQRLESSIERHKNVAKNIARLYSFRNNQNLKMWNMVNTAKSHIVDKSDGTLQIKLSSLSVIEHIAKKFIDDVTGSKGQPERTFSFFNDLVDGGNTYKNLLKFWLCLFRAINEDIELVNLLGQYGIINNHFIPGDLNRIVESFDSAKVIEYSLLFPTYNLELEYRKDSDNVIPFENASYGQQAGAILSILLNQETGPLIIDQPEDDLDNKVIHQITKSINKAKKKRQLIFTSHNANIAVNGDAELILCFDHNSDRSSGEINLKGAIDDPDVKYAVKDIMEGGKKAFDLRQSKYGF